MEKEKRDPRTPVEMEQIVRLPKVWLACIGLVGAGMIAHILLAIFSSGGLVVWPFIFAVCVLLIINDASSQNAVGVAPFQAYAFFFGTLLGLFAFVFLVSKTINYWVIIAAIVGISIYLANDWKNRKIREREIQRRRLAGVCVRCCEPVSGGIEDICGNCGTPVNPERLDLLRLGRAISNKDQAQKARQTLTGSKPSRADVHMQNLLQQRTARYHRKK